MSKIRVLVVDDAVVVRRLVSDVLSSDPDIEVVGVAANGHIALNKIPLLNPDIITLDIEMPVMNGLETVAAVRKTWPRLPLIMFSTLTERGAKASLDALALGANDYVTKPANVGSVTAARQCLRDDLVPKIKALAGRTESVGRQPSKARLPVNATIPLVANKSGRKERIDIVAIGVSTGGPNALVELIPSLPADLPVPVVIVQHMPPLFTKLLAERLHNQSALHVHEGAAGGRLGAGHAFLAPGGFHMVTKRLDAAVSIALNQAPPENSCRPAVDVLFRSVAEVYGPHVLAVVMTGMGGDGMRGCGTVREAGGQVIVQDRESSVVWGMPGAVVQAGLAEEQLPLSHIGAEIIRRMQYGRSGSADSRAPYVRSQSCL